MGFPLTNRVLCLSGENRSGVSGEVFQIATGIETSIAQIAALVQEVAGSDVDIEYGPPTGDIRKNYSGITKAQRDLGW
jgi:nucleoside-diphosphate-sugar epimerase